MVVRRDEAGHDDRAGAVDDFCVSGGDSWRNLDDLLPVDQNVGFVEVAHLRVEAEHHAAAQQDAAPPAVADQALEVCRRCRSEAGELRIRRVG